MLSLLVGAALAAPPPGPSFVLGGAPVEASAWPEVVALLREGALVCSGTRVDQNLVLSAAHCDPEVDVAVIGGVDLSTGVQAPVVRRRALFPPGGPDLALFELSGAPEGPAAVVSAVCTAPDLRVGAPVWIVGFGAIDPQSAERPGALRVGRAAIRDPECTSVAAGCNGALGDGVEMIAGGDGVDACIGDSGGPLFFDADGERVLIGVTSRGVLGQRDSCGGGGIFTRLDRLSRSDLGFDPLTPRCAVSANAPAPAPTRLRVAPGERAAVRVDPGDTDPGDRFGIEGLEASELGELSVEGLELRFAAGDVVGTEVLNFDVVDRAGQRGRGELTVSVGCACASTRIGAPWGIALVALVAVSRRRGLDDGGGGGQELLGRST